MARVEDIPPKIQSAIQGKQVYGPFGASSYQSGTINTAKGYTGQAHDGVSGLDYYVARYYDPVMGMFLSVDTVQGNQQGMDPYQYVGDNPETHNDPSGHCWPLCTMLIGAVLGAAISVGATVVTNAVQGKPTSMGQIAQAAVVGAVSGAVAGLAGPEAGPLAKIAVGALSSGAGQMVSNAMSGKPLTDGVAQAVIIGGVTGGLVEGAGALIKGASSEAGAAESAISEAEGGGESEAESASSESSGCALSFVPTTLVATDHGEQAIGSLKVGEKVWAYNPQTQKMELEPVQHVWLNHDNDLINLTLTATTKGSHGQATHKSEVIHTNEKHPFLTEEKGFVPVSQLKPGMHVLEANGSYGVVAKMVVVPGAMWMYNLTVAQDHTYTVGLDQWIVHNTSSAGCGVTSGEVDSYSKLGYRQASGDGMELHHVPAKSVINLFGISAGDGAAMALPDALHAATRTFRAAAIPILNDVRAQLAAGVPWNQVFRGQLASDLEDLRGMGVPNSQLQQLVAYWRGFAPYLMRK